MWWNTYCHSFKEFWGNIVVSDYVVQGAELIATQPPVCNVRLMAQDIPSEKVVNHLVVLACSTDLCSASGHVHPCLSQNHFLANTSSSILTFRPISYIGQKDQILA